MNNVTRIQLQNVEMSVSFLHTVPYCKFKKKSSRMQPKNNDNKEDEKKKKKKKKRKVKSSPILAMGVLEKSRQYTYGGNKGTATRQMILTPLGLYANLSISLSQEF